MERFQLSCPFIAIMSGVLLASGCVVYLPTTSGLIISPDEATLAYFHSAQNGLSFGPERQAVLFPHYRSEVRWRKIGRSMSTHRRIVEDDRWPRTSSESAMSFSPDSRYLAVLREGSFFCIDLKTGESVALAPDDERPTSFTWSGPDEIVYASSSPLPACYRHKVSDPATVRRVLPACRGIRNRHGALDNWSQHGRFIISPVDGGGMRLLDVTTGKETLFGHPSSWLRPVMVHTAWKSDDSEAVVLVFGDYEQPAAVFLVETETGTVHDLSERFRSAVGSGRRFRLRPQWTADDQYLLAEVEGRGGCLIEPTNWKIVPIGERVQPFLGPRWDGSDFAASPPSIDFFPAPGWVRVFARSREFAVDYAGQRAIQLTGRQVGPAETAIGRTGNLVATFGLLGIKVTQVDLSRSRPISEFARR